MVINNLGDGQPLSIIEFPTSKQFVGAATCLKLMAIGQGIRMTNSMVYVSTPTSGRNGGSDPGK